VVAVTLFRTELGVEETAVWMLVVVDDNAFNSGDALGIVEDDCTTP
jgi:hypothetical protein